jgi:hypothetical protein
MLRTAPLLVLVPLLGSCVLKHDPRVLVTPQRPTLTTSPATTAAGTFELEAGVAIDPGDFFAAQTTLKHGLDERPELFLGWTPYLSVDRRGDDGSGTGDTLVGMRRRVWHEDDTAVAWQMATKLPTGDEDDGLSSGEIDFFLAGMVSHDLPAGPQVVGTYELGVIGEPGERDTDLQHLFALAATKPVQNDRALFAELSYVDVPFGRDPLQVLLGGAQQARAGFVYDVALSIGLNEEAPDLVVLFGITTSLGRHVRDLREVRP